MSSQFVRCASDSYQEVICWYSASYHKMWLAYPVFSSTISAVYDSAVQAALSLPALARADVRQFGAL